ncbi:hypothetical protein J7K74_03445 [Candidatus Woesearchaeota archaeon]|nr:hypothetical protein [Candidatus Woesearchaeota archaeon]
MRKSQSALELILTYGWVILVLMIVVGALAYFGVLNPKSSIPSYCIVLDTTSPFTCPPNSGMLYTYNVELALIYSYEYMPNITNVSYSFDDKNFIGCKDYSYALHGSNVILLNCSFQESLNTDPSKVFLKLNYRDIDGLIHSTNIEYHGKVWEEEEP